MRDRRVYARKYQKDRLRRDPSFRAAVARTKWKHKLKVQYSLTLEQYDEMLLACSNACEICLVPFDRKPAIDHDHSTGDVRGLICRKCNSALGLAQDSSTVLRRMAEYLDKNR